ncbi:hypothetical protein KL953_35660 [Mycolicibacterium goodii]|uniref:hypothetical protein n=1 Tax=Mycolicibacterium goodii TaxID=134601 RepID=UPI001BDC45AF|nr:hypothetical protein [Mycolicibacterium goodii]MBU8814190.1 hypothetical protein [Mycolicibacterium goodii]
MGRPSNAVSSSEHGYLYLLGFDNGIVKAGSTKDLATRTSRHTSDAGRFGHHVVNRWNSDYMSDVHGWERTLRAVLDLIGTRTLRGREYFAGIPFSIAKYQAENLHRARAHHRCVSCKCVDPVDVRLQVQVVRIPTDHDKLFEIRLPCSATTTVKIPDPDVYPGGEYPLAVGDEVIIEISPPTGPGDIAWLSELPARLGGSVVPGQVGGTR